MTWGEAAGTGVDPCPAVPTSDVPPWGCPEGDYWGGVEGRWFPVPNLVPPTLSLSPYSHPCALLFATSLQGTLGLVGGCWSCAPPHPPTPEPPSPLDTVSPSSPTAHWGRGAEEARSYHGASGTGRHWESPRSSGVVSWPHGWGYKGRRRSGCKVTFSSPSGHLPLQVALVVPKGGGRTDTRGLHRWSLMGCHPLGATHRP